MADVNVQRGDRGSPKWVETSINRAAGPVASAPGFQCTLAPINPHCRPLTANCDRRARGCPCPRASSESKRSLEGEAPRTGSERRPGWPT